MNRTGIRGARFLLVATLVAVGLTAVAPRNACAGAVPGVNLQLIATAADQVVHIANSGVAGDDRLFIVRKRGIIQILQAGSLVGTPFLDIDSLVVNPSGAGDERGLLSVAFDPDYDTNGFFYVNYIDNSSDTVIARYQVSGDPDVANAGSAQVVVLIDQPASNHNGGQLQFGPDGYLYAGMGDGGGGCDSSGSGCNAQKTDSLLGSMLRLDVDGDDFPADPNRNYAIPLTNPFVGNAAFAPEIWSYGLRNPWRFSFDRSTGDLWIGDVGQSGATRREEVNFQASGVGGQNYGWPVAEGDQCGPGSCPTASCPMPLPGCGSLIFPFYQYTGGGSCAVTGGFVYRGAAIPSLVGLYVFGDYCSGDIIALNPADPMDDPVIEDAGFELTSFGEDIDGELYAAVGDDIYKLVDSGAPTPTPTTVPTPTETPIGVSCPATPAAGCRSAGKSIVKIKDDPDPAREFFLWKWVRGAATTQSELGADPVGGSTSYAVCLYDESGTVPSLAMELQVNRAGDLCAGKPCFKAIGGAPPSGRGWKYKDSARASDGVERLILKGGTAGKAKMVVKAKGASLPLPAPFSGAMLLAQDTDAIVQLHTSDGGECFESVFPAPATTNVAEQFKDKD